MLSAFMAEVKSDTHSSSTSGFASAPTGVNATGEAKADTHAQSKSDEKGQHHGHTHDDDDHDEESRDTVADLDVAPPISLHSDEIVRLLTSTHAALGHTHRVCMVCVWCVYFSYWRRFVPIFIMKSRDWARGIPQY